jgi:hypothetical protein
MTATMTRKRQTFAELRRLQRLAASVIMRRLGPGWSTQRKWIDNRPTRQVTDEFIKPNDRLNSLERIEIYNKQYWFRLIDCMYDDFPGLAAVLGRRKLNEVLFAYLEKYPSRSFLLRYLPEHLTDFLEENRKMLGAKGDLAIDMARFEWAQAIAFDSAAKKPLDVDSLLGKDPKKLRLGLQPYLVLLDLGFAIDKFVLQLKQHSLRGDASNAIEETDEPRKPPRRKVPLPRRERVFVAVHRFRNSLYYKRLSEDEFRLLTSLRDGKTLHRALLSAVHGTMDAQHIKECFKTWTMLGWFCTA